MASIPSVVAKCTSLTSSSRTAGAASFLLSLPSLASPTSLMFLASREGGAPIILRKGTSSDNLIDVIFAKRLHQEKLHRDHPDKLKRKPVPGPMAGVPAL